MAATEKQSARQKNYKHRMFKSNWYRLNWEVDPIRNSIRISYLIR